jgi:hypothetical protein
MMGILGSGPCNDVDYKLTIQEHPNYLHVRADGPHSTENARRFLQEAHEEWVSRGFDTLLLEQALVGPSIGLGNIFSTLQERLPHARKLKRIAWVEVHGREDGRKFLEDAARNRGVNLRTFTRVEDAAAWLDSRE